MHLMRRALDVLAVSFAGSRAQQRATIRLLSGAHHKIHAFLGHSRVAKTRE